MPAGARSVWSGFIRFSLVSVPVKAYTIKSSAGGGISFNQLHAECHSRIQNRKTCPKHGEVPADQIVSGYQFAKDQYVVIDPEEVEKLRPKSEKDIAISAFVKPDAVDAAQFADKSYYLLPADPVAQRPYSLLVRAMREQKRHAFAQVVMRGRKEMVVLRPVGKVLMMSALTYSSEMKDLSEFESDVADVDIPVDELKLAKTLTDALAVDDLDLTEYKDDFGEQLRQLIDAKVQGKQIVEAPEEPAPRIINLMDALQQSLAEAQKKTKKPPKQIAPSPAAKAAQGRKRKSS